MVTSIGTASQIYFKSILWGEMKVNYLTKIFSFWDKNGKINASSNYPGIKSQQNKNLWEKQHW